MDEQPPENKKKKKVYTPPAIEHEEVVEAIAGVCSSGWDGSGNCRIDEFVCRPAQF